MNTCVVHVNGGDMCGRPTVVTLRFTCPRGHIEVGSICARHEHDNLTCTVCDKVDHRRNQPTRTFPLEKA